MVGSVLAANGPDSLIWWDWVGRHTDQIGAALLEHVELTVSAVVAGLLVSIPFALVARRFRRARVCIFVAFGVLYTIPSFAMIFLLGPFTGFLTVRTAVIALACYTLLILVRNMVLGLEGVPADAREAAVGMGYRPWQLLVRVELPLALPSVLAGLRVATVSTVGLVTVTAFIGHGGLGQLILEGLDRNFSTPMMVGALLSVLLALTADRLLVLAQRLATPWARR